MRRTLRPRKEINYLNIVNDKSPINDSYRATKRISSPLSKSSNISLNHETSLRDDKSSIDDSHRATKRINLRLPKNSNSLVKQETPLKDEKETEASESDLIPSPPSDNDEEYIDTESSDDEYSQKKKKSKPTPKPSASLLAILGASDDEDEDEYKLQREKNMRDRLNVLKTMDLGEERTELKMKVASPIRAPVIPARKRSQPVRKSPKKCTRRSARLSSQVSHSLTDSIIPFSDNAFNDGTGQDEANEIIEENLDLASNDDDKNFFERIRSLPNIPYDSINDFTSNDFDKFSDIVKNYRLNQEPTKIIAGRITSLDFHRSESKLLLLGGDKYGNVCLWDIVTNEGISVKAHAYNTNHVSFSHDGLKFYSTSLDGTTRMGDIENKSSTLLYRAINEYGDESHSTWFEEFQQSLLIAHGDGIVKLLDLRAPSEDAPVYQCFKRSVRTVQMKPGDDNYFLTSSGTGAFGVFDLRRSGSKTSPIILVDLDKALTSAFYSAKGSFVLTTSNDDTIRIYDCRDNIANALKFTKIPHNNHGGRWLSVFKAKWQPQREDCFYVGSMLSSPKRIQAYGSNGKIFHEFNSPSMQTICPVHTAHQSKPILVGGNSSGRIHVFSPFQDLKNELQSLNNNEV